MKLKSCILSFLTFFSVVASAQQLNLDVTSPSLAVRQDSVVLSMAISANVQGLEDKNSIRLTPVISYQGYSRNLPQVLLNGSKAHKLYRRNKALSRRRGIVENTPVFAAVEVGSGTGLINYRASLPVEPWMNKGGVTLLKEVYNEKGEKMQSEVVQVSVANESVRQQPVQTVIADAPALPVEPVFSPALVEMTSPYKGSYISPESDATDERNQKEFNFSLDEARVMAEVNPQILSLRELYTVAISYKNNPEQFYKMIDVSVRIYPASPVANLNAAAAAIERGNLQAAGRFLQMASHETLAYKNCRGAYELMCNNTYEGIRLLKAAKAEGSEEADYNLKLFFESNQPK